MSSVGLIRARRRCDVVLSCPWARGVSAPNSRTSRKGGSARAWRVCGWWQVRVRTCVVVAVAVGLGVEPGTSSHRPRTSSSGLSPSPGLPRRAKPATRSPVFRLEHYSSRGGPSLAVFDLGK